MLQYEADLDRHEAAAEQQAELDGADPADRPIIAARQQGRAEHSAVMDRAAQLGIRILRPDEVVSIDG